MPRNFIQMSESANNSIQEISVVDVYDLASDIGKECEKIIDAYGTDTVKSLIPKCITALEMLEAFASEREIVASELQDLNAKILKLENEKVERSESRKRFEKELEAIEESWREETRELLEAISRLQDENRRLEKERNTSTPSKANSPNRTQIEDFHLIQKLKEQVDKQRTDMKNKEMDIEEKSCLMDTMKSEIERLKSTSCETKRKSKIMQAQVKTLCEERADFLAKIQDQHREMMSLKKQLGIVEKESEELMSPVDDEEHKPRFTVAELKEVLAERNDLKKRVNDLEEELVNFRPPNPPPPTATADIKSPEIPQSSIMTESIYDPYDLPVQGPLPQEPSDAPWKKSSTGSSGIRKFFRKLFSENDTAFPRSFTISTLTKMALSGPQSDISI
ncbi:RILP-like protein homolog [Chironomus tepperi]|uniref:RILP-like protein homolog n=1 Tax=Chironomus tepperi TaxID=113505 RepID=UPI00391F82D1